MSLWHPNARKGLARWWRRRRIAELHGRGLSSAQIADAIDVPIYTVIRDCHRLGLIPNRERPLVLPEPLCQIRDYLRRSGSTTTSELVFRLGASERWKDEMRKFRARLRELEKLDLVRSVRIKVANHPMCWFLSEGLPMTLAAARSMLLRGVPFGDVYELVAEADREVLRQWYLSEPGVPNLKARHLVAVPSGDPCSRCGGVLVRTGTCLTCQSCGDSSGGCG